MKKSITVLFFLVNVWILSATHNRAGEITYVQLSDLTYEITVTTFTYTLSLADRQQLDVDWGDNTVSTAERIEKVTLPNYYRRNVYKINHTYPGPGVYKIVVQDPNRNYGVRNIPNSVNVVFSISTILTVNPAMGRNSTPVLLNPPYDKAALGYVFIHNPAAYDPDGDSLSYKLTTCTREDGKIIENYVLPPATYYLRVDSVNGDLIWNTPADTGIYNVAMEIQEWRGGKKIGAITRDMQIEVFSTRNKPPENSALKDLCVEARSPVEFIVSATDPNGDFIQQIATSGVFTLDDTCSATFTKIDSVAGFSSSRFTWTPCYEAVRNQPYNIIFKADDNNDELRLSDIDNMMIKVLGPPPILLNALPEGKIIRLIWEKYDTTATAGFNIYRREGPSTFVQDSCTSGLPASTGFVRVGYISGNSTVSYVDSGNGEGLEFGKEYTYRIVAVFNNGAESKASNEITSTLVSGVPLIKNVSVVTTGTTDGSIFIGWKKPDRLDTIPAPGPWEYIIYRAEGTAGTGFVQITSIPTTDLNDTTFTDTPLNTQSTGYIYKIELWNRTPGSEFLVGEPAYASSVFLVANPGDRKVRFVIERNVPWINTRYDFFRQNSITLDFDSVGTTNQLTFTDLNLENERNYCYYVRSTGEYLSEGLPKGLVNNSQITCVTPVDNEPPCPPDLNVTSDCDSLYNYLKWTIDDPLCFEDVEGYKIYYAMTYEDPLALIATIDDRNIFTYKHFPGEIVSGCYAVSAFDDNGNEGDWSPKVCVDSCNFYEIPNVFTPNGDNFNDRLVAKASGLVEKIDFQLFNRNGLLIFSTDKPRIEWDGTYKGKIVSPGVYFYQCDVFERRITGLEQFHLSGFIHVITEKGAEKRQEQTK